MELFELEHLLKCEQTVHSFAYVYIEALYLYTILAQVQAEAKLISSLVQTN